MAVYLIQAGDNGPVKIGVADNVQSRLRELQCGNHETLTVIRVLDGSYREEAWSHQCFRHLHLRGEWFAFDPEMLTFTPAPAEFCKPVRPVTEAEQIISAFGGLTRMAEKMDGVGVSTISEWRRAGRIPHWRDHSIVSAARKHGIDLPQWFKDRSRSAA